MTTTPGRTIVAFGNFDLLGGRSWVIRTGLEQAGYRIELCRTETKGITGKWKDLRKQWEQLQQKPDAIYVPFLGHWVLPLAWKLGREQKIPVIFDAFLSLYDTEVHDRKRYGRWHPWAWFLWLTDWMCCRLCDVVLIDTEEHKEYFVKQFGVRPGKMMVLPIGCRTDLFQPQPEHKSNHQQFTVEFHGTFIPLQGIDTILKAASLLQTQDPQIQFTIIGKGQTYPAMRTLAEDLSLKNVEFIGAIPMEQLPQRIAEADVCLGIFGTTDKADRVIPNKAYEVLQCAKPLITGETTTAQRILHNCTDVLLSKIGDPTDLAEKILQLKNNPDLRVTVAKNGYQLSQREFQPEQIVRPLVEWLEKNVRS